MENLLLRPEQDCERRGQIDNKWTPMIVTLVSRAIPSTLFRCGLCSGCSNQTNVEIGWDCFALEEKDPVRIVRTGRGFLSMFPLRVKDSGHCTSSEKEIPVRCGQLRLYQTQVATTVTMVPPESFVCRNVFI